jgi:rhodanese-related sulfurtransferase
MKSTLLILFIFICTALVSSCSKYKAGTGGKAKITVKVINGNMNVADVDVQVMYKATTFPGTSASYSSTVIADNTGDAIFDNLKRGNYYFYCAVGIDSTLKEAGAFINIASKFGEQHVVIDFAEEDPF